MEDSGFDSDPKVQVNGISHDKTPPSTPSSATNEKLEVNNDPLGEISFSKTNRQTTDIQKKPGRQREMTRKSHSVIDQQPKKGMLNRNRLKVPERERSLNAGDTQPLVMIETDESEDEFAVPTLSKEAHKEITQQLIKDGYNLDLEPDDEDLDLIPPRPLNERCACCHTLQLNTGFAAPSCAIQ